VRKESRVTRACRQLIKRKKTSKKLEDGAGRPPSGSRRSARNAKNKSAGKKRFKHSRSSRRKNAESRAYSEPSKGQKKKTVKNNSEKKKT